MSTIAIVDGAVEPRGQLREHLARVAVTHAHLRVAGERQVLAHEVDELALELHDLLAGAWPGRRHVPGERERPAAEVQGRDGLALGAHEVHRVADAAHVLEAEPLRTLELDVRLRRAVDVQRPRSGPVP